MPVFHTKTIESILDPVAQQVSKLVILHEEAEDGVPMPDLQQPVRCVSSAVLNLVKVGRETISSSSDVILRQDMPSALCRVETSSKLLEEASVMLKSDPFSSPARKRLIEGSGGILQGTSSLLLCFDESEVRKIIRECHRVLDYLAVTEVVDTLDHLVQFLRDLSPCLSKVSREVAARGKELTHQVHSEILTRCLDQVKTLAPILICSMKIYIHTVGEGGGRGRGEAMENRNYLAQRMNDEINEIIRVLQLTSYDEEQSDLDNLTVLKKLQNAVQNKINTAMDWLMDPYAVRGGVGERALRQIIEFAHKVVERCLPADGHHIRQLAGELLTMTDALCQLREEGKGATPAAEALARSLRDKMTGLQQAIVKAVIDVDKTGGIQQTAHTVQGRMEQARKWLSNPTAVDDLGRQAIAMIVDDGRRIADCLPGVQRADICQLCDDIDQLAHDLANCRDGAHAQQIATKLAQKLCEIQEFLNKAVVNRVTEDFIDIVTPLKQFTEAVHLPEDDPMRDQVFRGRAQALQQFADRAGKTAKMVAACSRGGNKKLAEALQDAAHNLETLTPQLVAAGRIRMCYPQSKAADEHFDNLRHQWAENVTRMRNLCDEATDSADFIRASEEQMKKHTFLCEEAIGQRNAQKMVDNTSAIARLANRVLVVTKAEADNSEDSGFINDLNRGADVLQTVLPSMVQDAKQVAMKPSDTGAISKWRDSNRTLLNAVGQIRQSIESCSSSSTTTIPPPDVPPYPLSMDPLHLDETQAPPRPPLPTEGGVRAGGRSPPPPVPPLPLHQQTADTDEEDDVFKHAPTQPIMKAAHNLHREVRQWSAKDNDLIAAAQRMAKLMAHLSELVGSDNKSSKRELIATAKEIANASTDVIRIAKQLARECTDKRIRTNLLQVAERIPTIATQLKILSTVKATMLGAQASEEDHEATEMLVVNAQNLMESVKETVRAAEAASVKRHAQTHGHLRWVRRQPWYMHQ